MPSTLTTPAGPSPESREAGDVKKEFTERHKLRKAYWTRLLEYANQRTDFHANVSPGRHSYLGTGAGLAGLKFNYVIRQHAIRAELYIDRGQDCGDENLEILEQLESNRESIEQTFDGPLEWQSLDGKRACRIKTDAVPIGYRDEERWEDSFESIVDRMIRLERALRPELERLSI